jgi:hypothetical protein
MLNKSSGADIATLQTAGFAVGRPPTMIGFLEDAVWFGHGESFSSCDAR